jgi:hypothetical protein
MAMAATLPLGIHQEWSTFELTALLVGAWLTVIAYRGFAVAGGGKERG